ncbi:hypothetical protein BB561_006190 [Smittium simulii]|uniref:V-type proton ATPase subunit E n=1 Tax=Smittium simulii TaxID=133385 RepID=A0A2T9Y648_9FUNG|nr:hypothetical protein BB561_006190 [Smittium simulii]
MSLSRPLNDEEVYTEMKKMIAFIKQEALEKSREIKAKADEEFNIEKAKIVRQESVNIEKLFERKLKQTEFNKKINSSNMINKSRLQLLKQRQEVLNQLFEQAFNKSIDLTKNTEKYQTLLIKLCVQAFEKLSVKTVVVYSLKKDSKIVSKILSKASAQYTKQTGNEISASLNQNHYLEEDCGGGVVVSTKDNKVQVDNSLRARLNICSQELLPLIRVTLLGNSPNRKFFD